MDTKTGYIHSIILRQDHLAVLPKNINKILEALANEPNILVKGGFARLCLLSIIKQKGKLADLERWEIEKNIKDIDVAFVLSSTDGSIDREFTDKFIQLQKKLSKAEIVFKPENMSIVKAQGHSDPIRNIVESADLTINEVVMECSGQNWKIFYTANALKHLTKGWGVFVRPKSSNLRFSAGRVFPSALGIARLVKFLAWGKVNKIYFPKHWLSLHFQDYEARAKAGKWPEGATLGLYSLVLMENYLQNDRKLQKKAIDILCDLGFTNLRDPAEYIKQQKEMFEKSDIKFENKKLDIRDVLCRYRQDMDKLDHLQESRQEVHEKCEHDFERTKCDLCGKNSCVIELCPKCGKSRSYILADVGGMGKVIPLEGRDGLEPGTKTALMPCSLRMFGGQLDPEGFYPN